MSIKLGCQMVVGDFYCHPQTIATWSWFWFRHNFAEEGQVAILMEGRWQARKSWLGRPAESIWLRSGGGLAASCASADFFQHCWNRYLLVSENRGCPYSRHLNTKRTTYDTAWYCIVFWKCPFSRQTYKLLDRLWHWSFLSRRIRCAFLCQKPLFMTSALALLVSSCPSAETTSPWWWGKLGAPILICRC